MAVPGVLESGSEERARPGPTVDERNSMCGGQSFRTIVAAATLTATMAAVTAVAGGGDEPTLDRQCPGTEPVIVTVSLRKSIGSHT